MPTERERLATLEAKPGAAEDDVKEHWSILSGENGLRGRVDMIERTCERIEEHLEKASKGKMVWVGRAFNLGAALAIAFICYKLGWQ